GMPPAFVLSQDQTLRLTSDPQPQGISQPQDQKPKIRIPSLHALCQRPSPEPAKTPDPSRNPASTKNSPKETRQATEPQPLLRDLRPPPAHPFSTHQQQCQTA